MKKESSVKPIIEGFKKVVTTLFTRDVATFLFFLFLATIFWFMHSISARREIKVAVPLAYTGIPSNLMITSELPKEVQLVLKDEGRSLLEYYFGHNTDTLMIDLTGKFDKSGTINYVFESLRKVVSSELASSTQLVGFIPELVQINYAVQAQKYVPVKFRGDLVIKEQFVLADSIMFTPNVVQINGPKSILDTISCLYLDRPTLDAPLEKSLSKELRVATPAHTVAIPSKVQVSIPIEMITEKSFELPITGINLPNGFVLRTFPPVVKATFSIGLSKYANFSANEIEVYVNYEEVSSNGSSKVTVHISSLNPNISNLRCYPTEVEYLLEKY